MLPRPGDTLLTLAAVVRFAAAGVYTVPAEQATQNDGWPSERDLICWPRCMAANDRK